MITIMIAMVMILIAVIIMITVMIPMIIKKYDTDDPYGNDNKLMNI